MNHPTRCLLWAMLLLAVPAGLLSRVPAAEQPAPTLQRWSGTQAWEWYHRQPWLVGCNFLPSTAVNDVEMWQAESFDLPTIDRELGWAHDLGFNSVRVFLNYVVWEADAAGLKQRFDRFLAVADKHGLRVMPILFDDCFKPEPKVGKQDNPLPGVHNSQWVRSPGVRRCADQSCWPLLEKYVRDMVATFGHDRRVVIWDLYNEPAKTSLPLVEATFRWARAAQPSQPLASCWIAAPFSDLVNLHNYGPLDGVKKAVAAAKQQQGRPVIVTEWMARNHGSRFETHLPYFKAEKIGCWNWGLVAGRTQTCFAWGSKPAPGAAEPPFWFHDLLRNDGTPYRPREAAVIRYLTGRSAAAPPEPQILVPTAQQAPVTWRYTFDQPAADWFAPAFDDSGWKPGPAPFGRAEPAIGRQPRTLWTGSDIWLRREFQMPSGRFEELSFSIHYDEDATLYVDGVPAAALNGFNSSYVSLPMSVEAAAALQRAGRHHVAVHCHQTVGGQYIDVGIEGIAAEGNKP